MPVEGTEEAEEAAPAPKTLSQVQIIRSLAQALAWFEQEISWSVKPQSLPHLSGRIGELYAAMITRGQMALGTMQHGYDVVSAEGEHISVKTVTTSNHVTFNKATIAFTDRAMILRINVDEGEAAIEEIFDGTREELIKRSIEKPTAYQFSILSASKLVKPIESVKVVASATWGATRVSQLETGTIIVEVNGIRAPAAMPVLVALAREIGVSPLNGKGGKHNTRQLGAAIIAALKP